MIARLGIGLLIIAVVIGVLILGQGPGASLRQSATEQTTEEPGYSARNAEVIETGEDGRPAYTLDAPVVRQRPNDKRVQVDAPRMSFVASDGSTWHVSARAGLIHPDGANVDLYGNVKLDGRMSETTITVDTSIISFDTHSEVARTTAPVQFATESGTLNAKGLVANFKDGTVRLESGVHGTFPPK